MVVIASSWNMISSYAYCVSVGCSYWLRGGDAGSWQYVLDACRLYDGLCFPVFVTQLFWRESLAVC